MDNRIALASLSFAALALTPSLAHASGFATARFGSEHGYVVGDNPTAIYYNPAGLAESEGTHIWGEYDLALRGASYTHAKAATDLDEPMGEAGANFGKGTLFNVAGAPFLGASTKIKDFAFGLGFYVPLGGSETWDKNTKFTNDKLFPGSVDGPQRWYSITGTILSIYISAAAAYKIPGTGLSLGVSGNLIHSNISTIRARTAVGNDDMSSEGRSFLQVSGWQGSFGAGADFEAMPKQLWFGASYQARPNIAGGMNLNGTLQNYFTGAASASTQDVTVHQDLPDIVRWGARFAPTKELEFRLFGDWERWSAFKDQCISTKGNPCAVVDDPGKPDDGKDATPNGTTVQDLRRRWIDALGIRGGGSYWVKPNIELFLGAGYDSNAVPAEHLEPVIMDLKDMTVTLGGTFKIMDHLATGLSYTQFIFFASDTTGKSQNPTLAAPSSGPDSGGKYTQWIGVINANVDVTF